MSHHSLADQMISDKMAQSNLAVSRHFCCPRLRNRNHYCFHPQPYPCNRSCVKRRTYCNHSLQSANRIIPTSINRQGNRRLLKRLEQPQKRLIFPLGTLPYFLTIKSGTLGRWTKHYKFFYYEYMKFKFSCKLMIDKLSEFDFLCWKNIPIASLGTRGLFKYSLSALISSLELKMCLHPNKSPVLTTIHDLSWAQKGVN